MNSKDSHPEINHSNSSNLLEQGANLLQTAMKYTGPGIFAQFMLQTIVEGLSALNADPNLDQKTKRIINLTLLASSTVIMAAPDVYKACAKYINKNNRQGANRPINLEDISYPINNINLEAMSHPINEGELPKCKIENETSKKTIPKKKKNTRQVESANANKITEPDKTSNGVEFIGMREVAI